MLVDRKGSKILKVDQMVFTFDRNDTINKLPTVVEKDISILVNKLKDIMEKNQDYCFFNHLYKCKTLCATQQLALKGFNAFTGEDIVIYVMPLEKNAEVN